MFDIVEQADEPGKCGELQLSFCISDRAWKHASAAGRARQMDVIVTSAVHGVVLEYREIVRMLARDEGKEFHPRLCIRQWPRARVLPFAIDSGRCSTIAALPRKRMSRVLLVSEAMPLLENNAHTSSVAGSIAQNLSQQICLRILHLRL